MSTVIAFMPMNLRLYDREERDLRTYVSCFASRADSIPEWETSG